MKKITQIDFFTKFTLFIGQKMSTTLEALIETMVGVSNFMEVDSYDVIDMVVAELNIYREMEDGSKNR